MQLAVYCISYPFLWLLSKLPFKALYLMSDMAFFWVYHVFGYRKKVVLENLKLAFPEKDMEALLNIRKDFYHHFCDVFLESVKPMGMTKAEMKARYQITNVELLQELEQEKSVLVPCAHYANWEWNLSMSLYLKSTIYGVYQKIGNPYFDRLIKKNRAKWNTILITQAETVKTVIRNEKKGKRAVYGIVSDQSPQMSRAQFWGPFMGITVPIHNGVEIMARKMDLAVVFLKTHKVKRGFYKAELQLITPNAAETEPGHITETFIRLTEEMIREEPAHYLWTHRRWKHRGKEPI